MNRRRLLALAAAPLVLAPLAARAEQNEKRKKGGGASYIQIDTLTATILRADGRRGVMTVEAGIDVPDSGLRARAQALTPR